MPIDDSNFTAALANEVPRKVDRAVRRAVFKFCAHIISESAELAPISDTAPTIPNPRMSTSRNPDRLKPEVKNPRYLGPGHAGTLRNSGIVNPPTVSGDCVVCVFGFTVDYAAAVHEVLTAYHPEGQAKFLETAIRANRDKLNEMIALEIRIEFGAAA